MWQEFPPCNDAETLQPSEGAVMFVGSEIGVGDTEAGRMRVNSDDIGGTSGDHWSDVFPLGYHAARWVKGRTYLQVDGYIFRRIYFHRKCCWGPKAGTCGSKLLT